MKKYLLGIAVVLLSIAFSAFYLPQHTGEKSKMKTTKSTLIWFEVDENSGQALDPDNGMINPPGSCPTTGSKFCARALEFPGEVTYDGQYHIAPGVDITVDYNDQRFKN